MVFFTISLFLGGTVAISLFSNTSIAFAKHELGANLYGQVEVPPVYTQAKGVTEFISHMPNNIKVELYVNAKYILRVTHGHIHSGIHGDNGPVVVTLFNFISAQNEISDNGTISTSYLEGPM